MAKYMKILLVGLVLGILTSCSPSSTLPTTPPVDRTLPEPTEPAVEFDLRLWNEMLFNASELPDHYQRMSLSILPSMPEFYIIEDSKRANTTDLCGREQAETFGNDPELVAEIRRLLPTIVEEITGWDTSNMVIESGNEDRDKNGTITILIYREYVANRDEDYVDAAGAARLGSLNGRVCLNIGSFGNAANSANRYTHRYSKFVNVLRHEIGHAFGLHHSSISFQGVMAPSILLKREFTEEEIFHSQLAYRHERGKRYFVP